ncbi:unnamed protein product [Clonostachys rhizophaga]|uniref:Uncharacterized protein n=1 Tax=Clonostachys rhizophaga TaxID=160324 RepID=A0A9N9VLU0_9HYPO|nr:unnamed protein product [Clonostachys rhizophaga]
MYGQPSTKGVPGYSDRQNTSLPFDKAGVRWEPSSIVVTFCIIVPYASSFPKPTTPFAMEAVYDPNSPVNLFMKILLSATIFARPKSTLDPPPMVRHTVHVDFTSCWEQLETIRGLVTSSNSLLSQAARQGGSRDARWLKTRAFQKLMRAQQHAASRLTVHAPECPKGLRAEVPAAIAIMFERYLTAKGMPQDTFLNHLTEAHYIEFRAFYEADGNVADLVGDQNDNNLVRSHGDTKEGFQYADE